MLSVNEARDQLLSSLAILPSESVLLSEAAGRVLAESLKAQFDLPAFSNSSMDGFAVRAADIQSAGQDWPCLLEVVDDIPAGSVSKIELEAGQAARIMTGAPMPPGADAVVPVERTDFNDRSPGAVPPAQVKIYSSIDEGGYVRQKGEDVQHGAELLSKGFRLRPQDIGMAAMLGVSSVKVVRSPKIAILSTGDELLVPGSNPEPGKIYESNSLTIAALVESAGGEPYLLGIAKDNAESVQEKLDTAVDMGADLIISSAGVSVGAFDYVKSVVESHGELGFWRVNMRPGKPLAFGSYRDTPFIGLPGNPVSAYTGFEVFLRPALAKMSGWTAWKREADIVQLGEEVESDGRESYLRAVIKKEDENKVAYLTGHQGSGNQFSLVQATAVIIIPAGVIKLNVGDKVKFWNLS